MLPSIKKIIDARNQTASDLITVSMPLFAIRKILFESCRSIARTGSSKKPESFKLSVINKLNGKVVMVTDIARISDADV